MRPDRSSLRNALVTITHLLATAVSRTASVTSGVLVRSWTLLGRFLELARSKTSSLLRGTHGLLTGPVRRAVTGPVRTVLLGRRSDVSLLIVLFSPVLALGAAWWIGSTVGYAALEQWVRGTWYGTDPSLTLFLAVAFLVALGAVSAAINSGLVPTTVLVSAPIFGAAVTRYGTEAAYSWSSTVVSLPNAVGIAAVFAVAFGVPIALGGFLVGAGVRRVLAVLGGGSGPESQAERV